MQQIRVLFVCLGNICRSPLAEGVFEHHARSQGLEDRFEADSAGTSAWHAGEPPDPGSVQVARRHGLDISRQRSRVLVEGDLADFDFLVAMDSSNRRNIARLGHVEDERLVRVLEFDPQSRDFDVPDPYGGGLDGFEDVYQMLVRSMSALTEHMLHHGPRASS